MTNLKMSESKVQRFKRGLRDSIFSLLGAEVQKGPPISLADIRETMLAALGPEGAELSPKLELRLLYVQDVRALWYLRPEMVAVLSQVHGEARALKTVHRFTSIFHEHLPKSMINASFARLPFGRRNVRIAARFEASKQNEHGADNHSTMGVESHAGKGAVRLGMPKLNSDARFARVRTRVAQMDQGKTRKQSHRH